MYGALSPGFKWRPKLGYCTDGKNNTFYPETLEAYSYRHWKYLAKIKGKVVFNAYPYSNTTCNHQRNLLAELESRGIKIDITVCTRQSLDSFYSNALPSQYKELFEIQLKGTRTRKDGVYVQCHQKYYDTRKEAIESIKESIKACRKLGAHFSLQSIKDLKKEVEYFDAKQLEDARIERKKVNALRADLKPQLKDLGPISLDVFEQATDLNEITLTSEVQSA